ncbi:MAG: outer membrane lipoprotein chaperone LolA [Candidatus Dadabacteria bacterium]|nr:outer membrane lipoprotein chaperone LolA [Candidatus Dadabacteria bacterium]
MNKALSTLVVALLIAVPALGTSSASDLERVVENVQRTYEGAREFHASFEQTAEIKALEKVQKSKGEVWFKKPGKMRWNYYTPNRDEIVSDGSTFWQYDHEEKQVVETSIERVISTQGTTTFLQGLGKIKEQFNASFPTKGHRDAKGNYLVDLSPKDDSGDEVNRFTIVVDPKSWIVSAIFLYDPFNNKTIVNFSNIEINKGISDSVFKFKIPKGVEVIKAPPLIR